MRKISNQNTRFSSGRLTIIRFNATFCGLLITSSTPSTEQARHMPLSKINLTRRIGVCGLWCGWHYSCACELAGLLAVLGDCFSGGVLGALPETFLEYALHEFGSLAEIVGIQIQGRDAEAHDIRRAKIADNT